MASRPPRELIAVSLPDGFDTEKHQDRLMDLLRDVHGDGWEIDSIDLDRRELTVFRLLPVDTGDSYVI